MGGENKNTQKLELEIIPAILVKTKKEFLENIEKVKEYVKEIHVDVMDNEFVPNYTLKPEEIKELPKGVKYEFHWMVENPIQYIKQIKGNHLHQIHVETIQNNWKEIKDVVKESGGRLCIVLNPSTPLQNILPCIQDVERVLIMFVVPGYSHQKYITSMEEKVKELRKRYPTMEIEVDGGINLETISSASKAGADKFVSCSTIFSSNSIKEIVSKLKDNAYIGKQKYGAK